MGWHPGAGNGTGESPDREPGVQSPTRDPRLAQFAGDGSDGTPPPSAALALLADELSGPERRCPGATDNELVGLLRSWAAIESWAASARLGVIRELVRRDGVPSPGKGHGDLPESWSQSLRYELAAALACSTQSAETTAWLAWEQEARLPGTGALLDDGTLTFAKARAVTETFRYLTDTDAAAAEAMIVGQLAGKTYPQVLRLAEQAALTVDPGLAGRRRQQAQKRDARVSFFREDAGTAALSGRDLPPDEALAAMSSVSVRAEEYKESGAFGSTPMDVLRAYAYLDLLNAVPAETRIACAEPQDEAADAADDLAWAKARAAKAAADARAAADAKAGDRRPRDLARPDEDPASATASSATASSAGDRGNNDTPGAPGFDRPSPDEPGFGEPGPNGPGAVGSGSGPGPVPSPGSGPDASSAGRPCSPRPADLIVPLATLLGLAERPGEIQGFGLLDPALARDLAQAAADSPHTRICVTVTSPEGYATAHGCARPARPSRPSDAADANEATPALSASGLASSASLVGFPARLNLTIPASALPYITRQDGHSALWGFTKSGSPPWPGETAPPATSDPPAASDLPATSDPPQPDAHSTWTLVMPGGRHLAVRFDPVPLYGCDHRYQTPAYQPTAKLRHLVQVRDGTCTFPSCNRHARESDFEHAVPYDQGGRTCACNAGARSRACHHVKQSPGWTVTQPQPGWHQWTTPAGHIYTQDPKRYPA